MIEKKMPVIVYSRVSGYYQPVNQWNNGKKAEFKDRRDVMTGEYIVKREDEQP